MLKVYLIRHAESKGNKKGIKMGSDIDLELSSKGIKQVKNLREFFKDKKIKKIFSSNLSRAFETANIIGKDFGLKPIIDKDLNEIKIGDWADGKSDPLNKWIKYYNKEKKKGISREDIRPPNGENSWDHQKRIRKFLKLIEKLEGEIIVIAHSGTNKVIIGTINKKDPDEFYEIKQDNSCLNEIKFDGENWKVLQINKKII